MMKRSRSQKERTFLDLPLECQDPDKFGYFDDEQKSMIRNDALDLVLIENASELVRQVMMEPGIIEKVLTLLSQTYEGCAVLPSETFPLRARIEEKKDMNTGTEKEYEQKVNNMKKILKKIPKNANCVSAIFGLRVSDKNESGHYGSFIFYKSLLIVYVFDSMQATNDGSEYTHFFMNLARDIFGDDCIHDYDPHFNIYNSLQLTGGFSFNTPLMLDVEEYNEPMILNEVEEDKIRIQSTESQNHFCYMWGIWSIHLRMTGRDPYDVAVKIQNLHVDPLIVIKRYIWALFNYKDLMLINYIPEKYRDFFRQHFPVVWTNDPLRTLKRNTHFYRYRFPIAECNNLDRCIALSSDELKVINVEDKTRPTPESEELIKCLLATKRRK